MDDILERLTRLHPKSIDLSLDRIATLLGKLDSPHNALPPVVHVAGTNGKGSVIAYLRAMLEAAGKTVHVYTSPHLVHFNERIRVAGKLIENEALQGLLEEVETANGEDPITFFEVTTAAAFLAFSRTPADVVLLETGLGGRLDATNMIRKPALTIITNISEDHQQYLGTDIKDIATEKAGIMKSGTPVIVGSQGRNVTRLLKDKANKVGAPSSFEGVDWQMRTCGSARNPTGVAFSTEAGEGETNYPMPGLYGAYQLRNAALAIASARALRTLEVVDVPDTAISLGLKTVEWAGRMQQLVRGPLVEGLPEGWEVWIDGGHNEAAAKMIAQNWRRWRDKPFHVVFGMIGTKDPLAFLKQIEGKVEQLRTVTIPDQDAAIPGDVLAEAGRGWRIDTQASDTVATAVANLVESAPEAPGRILICGSLYLVGEVLKANS